jgi:precorrin-6B methylase 2
MQKIPDWIRMWRELAEARPPRRWKKHKGDKGKTVQRRWVKPDAIWRFIVARLNATPDATVLDIGAGTGAWSVLLAQHARQVTAVEMAPPMITAMRETLADAEVNNVALVEGAWPEVSVDAHDFSVCSHAMYGCVDFRAFIEGMVAATRRTCFLVLRVPATDGVMAEATRRVWGQPYDSVNFQVAYNALLQMNLYPHVLMGDPGIWRRWHHDSLEAARDEIKRRLGLGPDSPHDAFLMDLLRRRLTEEDGQYVWPPDTRSALIYWDTA